MPARIAGIILPNKPLRIALRYIYGIGPTLALKIAKKAEVDPQIRPNDLSESEVNRLREIIEKQYKVEGDLRRDVLLNIKRQKEIGSYTGMRHSRNLPVHGQRTKTNSRTVRGNIRRTMGSGRKPAAEKT
ncbi:30S ribosomal protein S13 [Candidatus Parcubacteria bacterium]|jgi:small subunit ribosomal protein S13|nr:MAG: 30S ribosomal protein S13 [Candidatus Parcubacteria bacterium]